MSLTSFFWGSSQFDELVDKATSELLPSGSEDIALNLEICDLIRSKAVSPSAAMKKLKSRLNHSNPNVQLLALSLVDTCIKNGGDPFLAEITSREFIDNLVSILKHPLNNDVKRKILYYIQNWSLSLDGKATMGYLGVKYRQLQSEGFDFPPRDLASSNAAMVESQVAPEWIDSDVCLRCRTPFTFTNRKHHCRNCGQVFDQQCSSKTKALPHFGITTEVRVCDSCHILLGRGQIAKSLSADARSPNKLKAHRHRSLPDYDEDLQRALEMSLADTRRASSSWTPSDPPLNRVNRVHLPEDDDPDLKAAIEASLKDTGVPQASAPDFLEEVAARQQRPAVASVVQSEPPRLPTFTLPNYDLDTTEADAVLSFNQAMEYAESQGSFSARHGHDIGQLFDQASRVRPKLAVCLDDTHRKQQILVEMNSKMSEVAKLYDQLLDQQLAHHRWRETPVSSNLDSQKVNHPPHSEAHRILHYPQQTLESQPHITHPPHSQYTQNSHPQYTQSATPLPSAHLLPAQQPILPAQMQRQSAWTGQAYSLQPPDNPVSPVIASTMNQATSPPLTFSSLSSPPESLAVSKTSQPSSQRFALPLATHPAANLPGSIPEPSPSQHSHISGLHNARLPPEPLHNVPVPLANSLGTQRTAIPLFPSVPQSDPQLYESYGSRLNGTEQPERKEALLIDL